ncbi:hypothetical protein KIW84_074457 [Lathyrus oleraceus]|uniref:CBS domain-containing protein n=1 Tax=Pisum sativum TaxID=3888 RepID=A0A9D4VU65_PEA|nr:hypothetical protein KIW84_074457 [Pisum sativum]
MESLTLKSEANGLEQQQLSVLDFLRNQMTDDDKQELVNKTGQLHYWLIKNAQEDENRDLNQLLCSTDGEPLSWTARAKIALDSARDGEVSEIKGERIKVLCTSGKMIVVKTPSIYHKDAKVPPCEMDDRTKLAYLHEPESLKNQTSRQRIAAYLSMQTAYELLPESGKVVTLDVDLPVKQAFRILHEQGVPMAPLGDFCKGQFGGVLSILDLYFNFKRARESWV